MNSSNQIKAFLKNQNEPKRSELITLHKTIMSISPKSQLWFLDGKNESGKIVTNPNIGYGSCMLNYADGSTKEFYRLGISPNKSGISIYIFGKEDKTYLAKTFATKIGKANVTGYCIKFKSLKDIDLEVLKEVIVYALNPTT